MVDWLEIAFALALTLLMLGAALLTGCAQAEYFARCGVISLECRA